MYVNNSATLFTSGIYKSKPENYIDNDSNEPTVRRLIGNDALSRSHGRYDGRRTKKQQKEDKYIKRDVLQSYLRAQQGIRASNKKGNQWSGRRQSDTRRARKQIEASIYNARNEEDDGEQEERDIVPQMQFQSNSMYNNDNNNNIGNDDQRLQQPKPVSKLNKLRTNSYMLHWKTKLKHCERN